MPQILTERPQEAQTAVQGNTQAPQAAQEQPAGATGGNGEWDKHGD